MLAAAQPAAWTGRYLIGDAHSGASIADLDGDGLMDIASGRFWERTDLDHPEQPRIFGGFFRNVGSKSKPRFALDPRDGPCTESFPICDAVRQNCVRAVDWDGDGKPDLIGCHFENSIRLYRNLGPNRPGSEPRFGDPEGELLLTTSSPQMISGADVVDWNGDGDLDILTGQGHGGSGLRFYERDWLEDERNGTHPIVTGIRLETTRAERKKSWAKDRG